MEYGQELTNPFKGKIHKNCHIFSGGCHRYSFGGKSGAGNAAGQQTGIRMSGAYGCGAVYGSYLLFPVAMGEAALSAYCDMGNVYDNSLGVGVPDAA